MGSASEQRPPEALTAGACPSEVELRLLLTDASDSPLADEIGDHLLQCSVCMQRMARLTNDDSLGRYLSSFRRVHPDLGEAANASVDQGSRGQTAPHCQLDTAPASAMRVETPAQLGRYSIERLIGRGGFGVVYLARDNVLDRVVALKLATANTLYDPTLRRRFVREAQVTAQLHHPNIVPIFEADEINGQCFLASEYVAGPTLADWIAEHGTASNHLAASVVMELAEAVGHAHEQGILHRDIKPGNVLLAERHDQRSVPFVPKLTDFGLAKTFGESVHTATADGMLMGTPPYMAPEQAAGRNEELGPATDVYALGATLFELLTARPPIVGENNASTLSRVLTEEIVPPQRLVKSVDRDLGAICQKCLEKRPNGRYASAHALADDLRRYLDGQPTVARPIGNMLRLVRWSARHPSSAGFAAMLVLGTVTVVGLLVYHNARLRQFTEVLQTALDNAEIERKRAEASDLLARQHLYCSDIVLANDASKGGDLRRATQLLRRHIPQQGDADVRGMEWYYLWRMASRDGNVIAEGLPPVRAVSYSRDGHRLAAGDGEGRVRIFAMPENRLDRILATGHGVVHAMSFTPDDALLATGGDDGAIRCWEAATGTFVREIPAHEGMVRALAISQDGKLIASGGEGGQVCLWNTNTGESIAKISGHTKTITSVAISPDSQFVASAAHDETTRLWSVKTGKQVNAFHGHHARVASLDFSPDGRHLATGGIDRTTRVWDVETGRCLVEWRHADAVQRVAFAPGGAGLVASDRGGTVRIYPFRPDEVASPNARRASLDCGGPVHVAHYVSADTIVALLDSELVFHNRTTGKQQRLKLADESIVVQIVQQWRHEQIALSEAGELIVCANQIYGRRNGEAFEWEHKYTLPIAAEDVITVAVSPDGQLFALGTWEGVVRVYKSENGQVVAEAILGPEEEIGALCFHNLDTIWAYSRSSQTVHEWQWQTGGRRAAQLARGMTQVVKFSSTAKVLVDCRESPGSVHRYIALWDLEHVIPSTGESVTSAAQRQLIGHARWIESVDFSPMADLLVTAEGDAVRLWDLGSDQCLRVLPMGAHHATFSPDGNELMLLGPGDPITLCSLGGLRQRKPRNATEYVAHTGRVMDLAFDRKRDKLVSAATDGRIIAWELDFETPSWKRLVEGGVSDIAFEPQTGNLLVVDSTGVHVCDPKNLQRVSPILLGHGAWRAVSVSADGSRTVFATNDGAVVVTDSRLNSVSRWSVPFEISKHDVVIAPDGGRVLVQDYAGDRVLVFDSEAAREVETYHAVSPRAAAFSPDGRTVAYSSQDDLLLVDAGEPSNPVRLTGHDSTIRIVQFSPDGRLLVSGADDRRVIVWDVAERKELFRFAAHGESVEAVAFAPDGRTLLTGDSGGSIKLWNLFTRQELFELTKFNWAISGLAVSPNGDWLVCQFVNGALSSLDLRPNRTSAIADGVQGDSSRSSKL